jgi:hypothetical protein
MDKTNLLIQTYSKGNPWPDAHNRIPHDNNGIAVKSLQNKLLVSPKTLQDM